MNPCPPHLAPIGQWCGSRVLDLFTATRAAEQWTSAKPLASHHLSSQEDGSACVGANASVCGPHVRQLAAAGVARCDEASKAGKGGLLEVEVLIPIRHRAADWRGLRHAEQMLGSKGGQPVAGCIPPQGRTAADA